jgi:pyruvate,water dikinase
MATVNGFLYARATPVGVEPGDTAAPLLNHPDVQKQIKRAYEVYNSKYWLSERQRWRDVVKPDSIRVNIALASVNVRAMGRDELLEHISHCRDNAIKMLGRHHGFTGTGVLPLGLLLADLQNWTDLSFEDGLSLVDGATPLSAGITPELETLAHAIREDADARALLASGDEPESVIERLRSAPGEVGQAMERFLLMDGHRLATGFDITDKMALELPEIMLTSIAKTVESGPEDRSAEAAVLARFVRNQVPPEHRETFDDLLADSRACFSMKDEKGLYNDASGNGILRKALLEAGRRLADDGRLSDAEHFLEAGWEEMKAIWAGEPGPSAAELAERRQTRMSLTWQDAPPFLGTPPAPPAPIEGLPAEIVRWAAAEGDLTRQGMYLPPPPDDADDLAGVTASKGTHEGVARVAVGDYDFTRINEGDVLVTSTHSEAYNAVARRVGAIVADTGGPLSHPSIVSRELGIPCIVACKNATTVIPDGALVRVDADTGIVTVLG